MNSYAEKLNAFADKYAEAILQGRSWYLNAMSRWQECVSAGVWPSRYDEVIEVDLPRWGYEI